MPEKDSPIVVERERLIFDIKEFPLGYYSTPEEYLSYGGKVTAEYTFYNSSGYEVTAKLLFPFGRRPMYAPNMYDEDKDSYRDVDDTLNYDITVNGEVIEKKLRHSFSFGTEFVLEKDLANLSDGYVEDEFYTPELPVTKYSYRIAGVDTETYSAATAAFDMKDQSDRTKVYFPEMCGYDGTMGEKARLSTWVKNGETMTIYVIGEALQEEILWKFYEDGGTEDKEEIKGSAELLSKETLTFEDVCMLGYDKESNIMPTDWYNARVQSFNKTEAPCGVLSDMEMSVPDYLTNYLMRWYEYEITLASGEKMVNTVTAPMYPTIDGEWEPAVFQYTYLLSPAKTWKEFGPLEILIQTPFYMTESTTDGWEKTENGYRKYEEGLPEGELEFTLCSEENPKIPEFYPLKAANSASMKRRIGLAVIGGCVVLLGVATVVICKLRAGNRKKQE